MQAVILAAGRGKRLHPITATRTKAMAPILGKPIVERVMDKLVANGLREFILVVSPDDEEIFDHFRHRSQVNADLTFVVQSEPLGMGHALLQAAPHIKRDFMLSSCDNLVPEGDIRRLIQVWENEPCPNGLLSLLRVRPEKIVRMGVVKFDGQWITKIVEKPSLEEAPSNIGSVPLYCFSNELLDYLSELKPSPRGEYELQPAIQMLIQRTGKVRGAQISRRIDLTTPADLLAINKLYFTPDYSLIEADQRNISPEVKFIPPYHIEAGVSLGANCIIGPEVYIEKGCTIGDNVRLENVIALRERVVPDGSQFQDQVVY